jgi:branched-chain amino acid transport system ATP-binding protein
MTVIENLEMALLPWARPSLKDNLKTVMEFFPILRERSKQLAGTLSGREQQMLL